MKFISSLAIVLSSLICLSCTAQKKIGADITWITYEAEHMQTNGTILQPSYQPHCIESESSNQQCVKLNQPKQYVTFAAKEAANSIVIRYSLPDSPTGGGVNSAIDIFVNGQFVQQAQLSSKYALLYGAYPFSNNPADSLPRNFYDEARVLNIKIQKGDSIKLQWSNPGEASFCILDFIDLEQVSPAIQKPDNSLSITDTKYVHYIQNNDYTEALKQCIVDAAKLNKPIWIPQGAYIIAGDIELPSNITIQGAGMWYTTLNGDETKYTDTTKRVRFVGKGENIHLSDFSIIGKLTFRNDPEPNDGIWGEFGKKSTISNLWIEHTKVGMWLENAKDLIVSGCRFRNVIADGINLSVGTNETTVINCTARGTGDDGFAIWPAIFRNQKYVPGNNLITQCTAEFPFLANGIAIYGGESNRVTNCLVKDITLGSAILISTTFPVANEKHDNNFSGITRISDCVITKSGGYDHVWQWRGAVQVCVDKRNIKGLEMNNLVIEKSLSDGLNFVSINEKDKTGVLSDAVFTNINITTYGIATPNRQGVWIQADTHGSALIQNSSIPSNKNESKQFTLNTK